MADNPDSETQVPATETRETVPQADQSYNFHGGWSSEERTIATLMVNSLENAFPDYDLPEGLEVRDNSDKGHYYGRDSGKTEGEVPLIEVKPERRFESLGHELGHDIHYQLLDDIHDNGVVANSFKEAFADLVMLYAVPVTPETRDLERDLSRYDGEFEVLKQMLDPGKREDELRQIMSAGLALYRDDLEGLNRSARDLVEVAPQYGRTITVDRMGSKDTRAEEYEFILTEDGLHSRENMFMANLELGNVNFEHIAQMKMDVWRMSEALTHQDVYTGRDPVEEALEDDSRIAGKLRFTEENRDKYDTGDLAERPYEVIETTLNEAIDLTHRMIDNYLAGLQEADDMPGELLEGLEHVKYGNSYDESVDFPHNVGGEYAEELYRAGVTPYDLLADKDKHVEALERRLKDEIGQRL